MPPANYTGPEPSDPARLEQAYRPVVELTRGELCEELTEARQTLEAIYPYTDRATSARMREIRRELTHRDVAAAEAETERLRAAGWTQADFAAALADQILGR